MVYQWLPGQIFISQTVRITHCSHCQYSHFRWMINENSRDFFNMETSCWFSNKLILNLCRVCKIRLGKDYKAANERGLIFAKINILVYNIYIIIMMFLLRYFILRYNVVIISTSQQLLPGYYNRTATACSPVIGLKCCHKTNITVTNSA